MIRRRQALARLSIPTNTPRRSGSTVVTCSKPTAKTSQAMNSGFLRDIAPVAGILRSPYVMEINLAVPASTVPEFIAYAKADPGKISMASSAIGNGSHLAGELFKFMTGINMVHVPYRGDAPAMTDLLGGQVQVYFGALTTSIEQIRTGRLRALAVTTAMRSEVLLTCRLWATSYRVTRQAHGGGSAHPRRRPPR